MNIDPFDEILAQNSSTDVIVADGLSGPVLDFPYNIWPNTVITSIIAAIQFKLNWICGGSASVCCRLVQNRRERREPISKTRSAERHPEEHLEVLEPNAFLCLLRAQVCHPNEHVCHDRESF